MESWIPLLVALAAASPGIISLWRGRRKQSEEVDSLHVRTADTLIENLREDNLFIRARFAAARADKEIYREYAQRLHRQLRELGVEPCVPLGDINKNGETKPDPKV